jgi:hypothetical protein
MDPKQASGKTPAEPKWGRKEEWAHARKAFDTVLERSHFPAAFDQMLEGRASVETVLTLIRCTNTIGDVTNFSKEVLAMRSRFRSLGKTDPNEKTVRNEHLALFLQQASLEVPALQEPFAAEIIYALRQAAGNKHYFADVDSAVDTLLTGCEGLSEPKTRQLTALRKTLDKIRRSGEGNGSTTQPEISLDREDSEAVPTEIPSDHQEEMAGSAPVVDTAGSSGNGSAEDRMDEVARITDPIDTVAEGFGKGMGVAVCMFGAVAIAIMASGAFGHRDRDEPAPQQKIVQPVKVPAHEQPTKEEKPAQAEATETAEAALKEQVPNADNTFAKLVKPSDNAAGESIKSFKGRKPRLRKIIVPTIELFIETAPIEEKAVPQENARSAAMMSTDIAIEILKSAPEDAKKRLSSILSPDASARQDPEAFAVDIFKLVASEGKDDVALFALDGLKELSKRNPDAGAAGNAASQALKDLSADPSVRSDAVRKSLAP